ncbi:MAG: [NiFe]-hydrogenase assembly chaperone HybE [Neptuniibacter sp.]
MSLASELQLHFINVSEKMAELPIYNPELDVAVVCFRPYQQGELGVLVTPWCMNLIMIPDPENTNYTDRSVGAKQMLALPSGQYEFIWGAAEGIGSYLSCSLFSPMFEFDSHKTAIETAEEVIKALFEVENFAPTDRQIAKKVKEQEVSKQGKQKKQKSAGPTQVSRRGFLTAGLARSDSTESESREPV